MSGVYNPHSHQASAPIVVQPQVVQPVTYKTIRVQIPAGMNPGSKLKVLTDNTGRESAIVTIPDRGRWRYGASSRRIITDDPRAVAIPAPGPAAPLAAVAIPVLGRSSRHTFPRQAQCLRAVVE